MTTAKHPKTREQQRQVEYCNLVSRTAEFRKSEEWNAARGLMANKGYDPNATILVSHDPGEDFNTTFVLQDGAASCCEFRDDAKAGQAIRISGWEIFDEEPLTDDVYTLASEILQDTKRKDAFNRAVANLDFHLDSFPTTQNVHL